MGAAQWWIQDIFLSSNGRGMKGCASLVLPGSASVAYNSLVTMTLVEWYSVRAQLDQIPLVAIFFAIESFSSSHIKSTDANITNFQKDSFQ